MLYMIGLGLGSEKDVSVRGLEAIKSCEKIYLEGYTSKLQCKISDLEELYGKKIILADRELVEQKAEETILKEAETEKVAFLVIGDVFGATTHVDLMIRAKGKKIIIEIMNNASILTGIGVVGLELYKYGKTTSIPFENKNITAPIEVIKKNQEMGLHTLVLLDLCPKEDKFMTIKEAGKFLTEKGMDSNTKWVGCSAIGTKNQKIIYTELKRLVQEEFKSYPRCLIIPGKLHFMEEEVLDLWK